jgi:hypothetical protein
LNLFLTAFKLSIQTLFIVVTCRQLSSKPWPLIITNSPLYLITNPDTMSLKLDLVSHDLKIHINYFIKRDENSTLKTFKMMFQTLDALEIYIKRLQWTDWRFLNISVAAGLSFEHVEQLDSIQSSGWARISVQLSVFGQKFLFKPEKFVCDELGFFGFGLSNPRVGLTDLLNSRVVFKLLYETQSYDQTSCQVRCSSYIGR